MDRKLNLETSPCTRMLTEDGILTEDVRLYSISAGFSEDELERIERKKEMKAHPSDLECFAQRTVPMKYWPVINAIQRFGDYTAM